MSHTKTFSLTFFIAALVCALPLIAFAQASEMSVSPVVVDKKAKARDILKETVTITNTSNRRLNLYPSVHDVDATEGQEPFESATNAEDRADSLANWIELSRGVIELGPGEEKSIPFTIRVNLNAVPNTYHAQLSFSEGSTRERAEEKGALATVMVNVEVQADIKEVMQLNTFNSDGVFFSGDDVLFNYQLENIGNQELEPKGEIRIYDRKGREVTAIDINDQGKKVAPDQVSQLASVWSAVEGFGKYKAFLTVNYGRTQTASVQDTIYFWIIPWKQLLAVFAGSLVAVILLALYFHRWFERRHMHRLAFAGGMPHDGHEAADEPIDPKPSPTAETDNEAPEAAAGHTKSRFAFLSALPLPKALPFARRREAAETKPTIVEESVIATAPELQPLPPQAQADTLPHTQQPARRSLKEALGDMPRYQTPQKQTHGTVVDLKQLRKQRGASTQAPVSHSTSTVAPTESKAHVQGHVISLKKRQ